MADKICHQLEYHPRIALSEATPASIEPEPTAAGASLSLHTLECQAIDLNGHAAA